MNTDQSPELEFAITVNIIDKQGGSLHPNYCSSLAERIVDYLNQKNKMSCSGSISEATVIVPTMIMGNKCMTSCPQIKFSGTIKKSLEEAQSLLDILAGIIMTYTGQKEISVMLGGMVDHLSKRNHTKQIKRISLPVLPASQYKCHGIH